MYPLQTGSRGKLAFHKGSIQYARNKTTSSLSYNTQQLSSLVIKVFEDFDITLVGYYQSVLKANGIDTFMKNQFGTGGLGELPFVEVVPQLWVLNEAQAERAIDLLKELQDD